MAMQHQQRSELDAEANGRKLADCYNESQNVIIDQNQQLTQQFQQLVRQLQQQTQQFQNITEDAQFCLQQVQAWNDGITGDSSARTMDRRTQSELRQSYRSEAQDGNVVNQRASR